MKRNFRTPSWRILEKELEHLLIAVKNGQIEDPNHPERDFFVAGRNVLFFLQVAIRDLAHDKITDVDAEEAAKVALLLSDEKSVIFFSKLAMQHMKEDGVPPDEFLNELQSLELEKGTGLAALVSDLYKE